MGRRPFRHVDDQCARVALELPFHEIEGRVVGFALEPQRAVEQAGIRQSDPATDGRPHIGCRWPPVLEPFAGGAEKNPTVRPDLELTFGQCGHSIASEEPVAGVAPFVPCDAFGDGVPERRHIVLRPHAGGHADPGVRDDELDRIRSRKGRCLDESADWGFSVRGNVVHDLPEGPFDRPERVPSHVQSPQDEFDDPVQDGFLPVRSVPVEPERGNVSTPVRVRTVARRIDVVGPVGVGEEPSQVWIHGLDQAELDSLQFPVSDHNRH